MKMFRRILCAVLAAAVLWTSAPIAPSAAAAEEEKQSYFLKLKDMDQAESLLPGGLEHAYAYVPIVLARLTAAEADELAANPLVEYVEPEYTATVSALPDAVSEEAPTTPEGEPFEPVEELPESTEEEASGEPAEADTAPEAPLEPEISADPYRVAVLDSGFAPVSGLERAGGVSFLDGMVEADVYGHGTFAASVISRLAPDADLYDVQIVDGTGKVPYGRVMQGIEWALANGMDLVVMGFGASDYSIALAEMTRIAEDSGLLMIAAAGNDGAEAIHYPARYGSVVAVGALNEDGTRWPLSNRGNELELMAPGIRVEGLDAVGEPVVRDGTSAAAAYAAGIAALYGEAFPTLSAGALRELLRQQAEPLGAWEEYGYGRVRFHTGEEPALEEQPAAGAEEETGLAEETKAPPEIEGKVPFYNPGEDLEELGRLRLESEQVRMQAAREAANVQAELEREMAKLDRTEIAREFGVEEEWMQRQFRSGATSQDVFAALWEARETSGGAGVEALKARDVPISRRETVNVSLGAQSEIVSRVGSHIQPSAELLPMLEEMAKEGAPETSLPAEADILPDGAPELMPESGPASEGEPSEEAVPALPEAEEAPQDSVPEHSPSPEPEAGLSASLPSKKNLLRILDSQEVVKPVARTSEAPYTVGLHAESVSLLSGSLSVAETDLTLPGRGGLSFTLGRTYDSNSSQLYEMDVGYTLLWNYGFDYIRIVEKQPITYSFIPRYTKYLKKYACGTNVLMSTINQGIITGSPFPINSMQGLDALYGSGIPKSPEEHACHAHEANRWYKYEYVYSQSNSSHNVIPGSWVLDELSYGSWPWTHYNGAVDGRNAMIAGAHNSSGQGGSYYTGYHNYQITYSNVSGITSQVASSTPYNIAANDPLDNRFPIGKGWRWSLPYVKNDGGKKYVGLEDGGVYEVDGTQLKNYPWSDLSFVANTSVTVGGRTSSHALVSVFGTKTYFDSSGNLLSIRDAYGNATNFAYSTVSPYGLVLTSVTDAAGNTLTIQYNANQVILTAGGRTVTYTKTTVSGKELLTKVTDPMNRETTYSYEIESAHFNLAGTTPSTLNPYALLTKIVHPTGAETKYTYEVNPVTRRIASNQVNQAYRLANRKDEVTYSGGTPETFNYSSLVYSGDMAATYGSDTTFFTTLFDGLLETKATYFRDYISSTVGNVYYQTESSVNDGAVARVTSYTYDQTKRRTDPIAASSRVKNVSSGAMTTPVTSSRTFDDYRNVTSATNEHGLTSTYAYHSTTKRLVNATEPVHGTQSLYTEIVSRNAAGDVTEMKKRADNASGAVLEHGVYAYDAYGNPTLIRFKEADKDLDTTISYSSTYQYAYPTQVIRSYTVPGQSGTQQHTVSATYNAARGTMVSYTDGRGLTTSYTYDALNRLTGITYPGSGTVSIVINDIANEVRETNEAGVITYVKWNTLGWETEAGYVIGAGKEARAKTEYDVYGRPLWSEDGETKRTTYVYDDWDRVTTATLPLGNTATSLYDDMQFTAVHKDAEGRTVRETSDRFGRLIKTELQIATNDFRKTWFGTYDSANRLISAEDDRNYVTQYAYDRLGRLTQVTGAVPGEVYAYGYNRRGLLTGLTYPDQSAAAKTYDELGRLVTATDPMNRTDTYKYDGNHNVIQSVEKSGQTFTFAYDNRNRLTSKAGPGSTISFEYYAQGARKKMTDNGNRVTNYAYDSGTGELTGITYPDGRTIGYQYDDRGLRTQMTTPFGDTVGYTYDNNGRLTHVKWNGGTMALYQYAANGSLASISRGNGIYSVLEHDAAGRLKTLRHMNDTTALYNYAYTYDANQNITDIDETIVGSLTAYDFTYDAMNRLLTSSQFDEVYTYDVRGNRQTLMSEWDRYAGAESASYTYDAWNRLTKATLAGGAEVEYKYNGDNLLTERTENGVTTRYYYDGGHIVAEGTVQPNGTATEKASYMYGIGPEMRENAAGARDFYLKNGHGDIMEVRSATRSLLASYRYDVWGNTISETGTDPNPFRYSGEYWDATVNLQYLRARWYDPSIGRFITEDSYQGELNNPLSLNLYTYVYNNPLKYHDPSGNVAVVIGIAIAGAVALFNVLAGLVINEVMQEAAPVPNFGPEVLQQPGLPQQSPVITQPVFQQTPVVEQQLKIEQGPVATQQPKIQQTPTVIQPPLIEQGPEVYMASPSQILKRNMITAGVPVPSYPNAAHHIVAEGRQHQSAINARGILQKYGININDPNNGVFLPTVQGASNASYHRSLHTDAYYQRVEFELQQASSRSEAIQILQSIGQRLQQGNFP